MDYFVLMCYGHSISSPWLTLPTNTTLVTRLRTVQTASFFWSVQSAWRGTGLDASSRSWFAWWRGRNEPFAPPRDWITQQHANEYDLDNLEPVNEWVNVFTRRRYSCRQPIPDQTLPNSFHRFQFIPVADPGGGGGVPPIVSCNFW